MQLVLVPPQVSYGVCATCSWHLVFPSPLESPQGEHSIRFLKEGRPAWIGDRCGQAEASRLRKSLARLKTEGVTDM
jgi:hypothetical protein